MDTEPAARAVFRLPPPATSRMVLLGTSLGAFALFAASWVVLRAAPVQDGGICLDAGAAAAVTACTDGSIRARGVVLLAAPLLLAALAVAGAALLPRVLVRLHGLHPVPAGDPVRPALARLTAAAGLRREPEWYEPPGVRSAAWTFGYGRRHRIAVSAGDLAGLVSETDRRADGLVAHELAHLRNRDVDSTYTLLAAATAAAAAALVLLVDAVVRSGPVGAALAVRTLGLAALVGLTLLAVLRTREHDADLRAALTEPVGVRALVNRAGPGTQRLPVWLRHHPPVERRRALLADPAAHLRVSPVECLTTGLAAGLTITELSPVVDRLLVGLQLGALPAYLLVGAAVGLLIVAVVGASCARAHLVGRPSPRTIVLAGAALGAGLLGGTELSLRSSATWSLLFATVDDRETRPSLLTADPAAAAWLAALAVVGGIVFVGWASAAGRLWVRRPSLRPVPAALVATAVLAAPLGGWFLAVRLAAGSTWPLPLLSATLTGPVGLAVLLAAVLAGWAVLAVLRRRTGGRGRRWAGPAVAAGLVLAVTLPGTLPGTAFSGQAPDGPAVPATRQAGIACAWLQRDDVLTRPRSPAYLSEVGRYLAGTDEPGLRALGIELTAAAGEPAAREPVTTALARWCRELIRRPPGGTR